jgi:hypothetical protein
LETNDNSVSENSEHEKRCREALRLGGEAGLKTNDNSVSANAESQVAPDRPDPAASKSVPVFNGFNHRKLRKMSHGRIRDGPEARVADKRPI